MRRGRRSLHRQLHEPPWSFPATPLTFNTKDACDIGIHMSSNGLSTAGNLWAVQVMSSGVIKAAKP